MSKEIKKMWVISNERIIYRINEIKMLGEGVKKEMEEILAIGKYVNFPELKVFDKEEYYLIELEIPRNKIHHISGFYQNRWIKVKEVERAPLRKVYVHLEVKKKGE